MNPRITIVIDRLVTDQAMSRRARDRLANAIADNLSARLTAEAPPPPRDRTDDIAVQVAAHVADAISSELRTTSRRPAATAPVGNAATRASSWAS